MLQIAVLVSGGGTNLQAIIDSTIDGILKDKAEVNLVISNVENAYGLKRAENHNILNAHIPFNDEFDKLLIEKLKENNIDLIVQAGFLRILSKEIIEEFENKIINIHPSLIPSFCGKGFYGLKVHEAAINCGVKVSGATVHFVDKGIDTGAIILQKAVYLDEDETPESLQKKILNECEYIILPKAIELICDNRVYIEDGIAKIRRK